MINEIVFFSKDTVIFTPQLGTYVSGKLINTGTKRWSYELGLGVSPAIEKWTLEASAVATMCTDNNAFNNGNIDGAVAFKSEVVFNSLPLLYSAA